MLNFVVQDEEQMVDLGLKLAGVVAEGDVLYLIGDLGVGKTTLVKGIAAGLGYKERVVSPTFTIMNVYEGSLTIYHCDFYRLEGEDPEEIGLGDLLGRAGLFLIEWPQNMGREIYPPDMCITIQLEDDDYDGPRRVILQAISQRGQEMLKELKNYGASGC